jgi:mycothiol synthase
VQGVVDLLTRPYRNDDAPTLAGLLNLLDLHAGSHGGYTSPEVQTTLVRDLADDTSMLFSPEGDLVAAAVNFSPTLGGNRVDLVGGVHPGWRGKGIGRELLASQLARAQAIHAV